MKKISLLFSCFIYFSGLYAQCSGTCGTNFLVNPGFETSTSFCSPADIQLYNNQSPVQGWFGTEVYNTIVGSSPDYFSPCAGSTNAANNSCISGSGRIGIFTKTSFSLGREYVQSQLTAPLVAGKVYCFSMTVKSKVGAAGNLLSSCDGIGAWFHNQGLINIATMNGGSQFLGPGSVINAAPQVENPSGNLIGSSCVTVSGSFCAQGGEQWIVLGNFRDDATTQISGSNPSNYMYIDDVALFEICKDVTLSASSLNLSCGQSATLTATLNGFSSSAAYSWISPSGNNLSGPGPHVVSPTDTMTYTVVVSEPGICGGTVSDTATITINSTGNCSPVTSVQGATICSGNCTTLLAAPATGGTAPYTYTWIPNIGSGNGPFTVCPLANTQYKVTVTDAQGNSYSDSTMVVVNAKPVVNAGQDVSVCAGSATTLIGSASAGVVQWQGGPAGLTYAVSPAATTAYVFQSVNAGCSAYDTVLVTVQNAPSFTLNHTDVTCFGYNNGTADAVVSSGTPVSYLWSPGGSTSASLSNLAPNTYTVAVKDVNGCTKSNSVLIAEPPKLSVSVSGNTSLCSGQASLLQAVAAGGSGQVHYLWSTGQTTTALTVAPAANQNYSIAVSDVNGCKDSVLFAVTVHPSPVAAFSGSYSGCSPVLALFSNTSSGATSYSWNFGDNTFSAQATPVKNYAAAGCFNVSLIALNAFGCSDTMTKNCAVTVYPVPQAAIVSQESELTELEPSAVLMNQALGFSNCELDYGDGIQGSLCELVYTHTYASPGIYTVTQVVSNAYGCVDTATTTIEVKPESTIWVPNAFTPNNSGDNNSFMAVGMNLRYFEMNIFDRWGERIFTGKNIDEGWNGTKSSVDAPEGIYIWTVEYAFADGLKKKITGTVTLLR